MPSTHTPKTLVSGGRRRFSSAASPQRDPRPEGCGVSCAAAVAGWGSCRGRDAEQRLGEVGRIDKFNVTGAFPNESVVIGISHKYKLQGDLHFILFIPLQS